jgi:hypothetical protein
VAKRRSKNGVNVSAAIREYLSANPEAAKAISEQIGQTVSPTYVSNIKSVAKGGKANANSGGRRRRGRPRGTAAPRAGRPAAATTAAATTAARGSLDLVTLESMKQIVSRVGADTARRLIDVLA